MIVPILIVFFSIIGCVLSSAAIIKADKISIPYIADIFDFTSSTSKTKKVEPVSDSQAINMSTYTQPITRRITNTITSYVPPMPRGSYAFNKRTIFKIADNRAPTQKISQTSKPDKDKAKPKPLETLQTDKAKPKPEEPKPLETLQIDKAKPKSDEPKPLETLQTNKAKPKPLETLQKNKAKPKQLEKDKAKPKPDVDTKSAGKPNKEVVIFVNSLECNTKIDDQNKTLTNLFKVDEENVINMCNYHTRWFTRNNCNTVPSDKDKFVSSVLATIENCNRLAGGKNIYVIGVSHGGGIVSTVAKILSSKLQETQTKSEYQNVYFVTLGSTHIPDQKLTNNVNIKHFIYENDICYKKFQNDIKYRADVLLNNEVYDKLRRIGYNYKWTVYISYLTSHQDAKALVTSGINEPTVEISVDKDDGGINTEDFKFVVDQ